MVENRRSAQLYHVTLAWYSAVKVVSNQVLFVTGIASLTHSPEASGASKTPSHAYTLLVLGVFIRLA